MTRTLTVAVALVVILTGCSFDRPYPDKSYYVLEAAAPEAMTSPTSPTRAVRVPRAGVAPPFTSRALQYRVGENQYEPSYYHNWADDPGALVAAAAREVVGASGTFIVLGPDSSAAGGETLELYVAALYVDVTGASPSVVVTLRATLVDGDGAVVLSKTIERTEPAASADAEDAVRAFNAALRAAIEELMAQIG
ncbi:MAG: ABC-type transport auxiliary lipoprotein family protein [Planctomycetota bacterium]|jgi:ABC-type uncharacterized transport system auxiliary subunit